MPVHTASRALGHGVRYPSRVVAVDGWRLGSIGLLLLILLLIVTTFRDYGISWDERVQKEYGEHILAYYQSGFTDRTAVTPDDVRDDGNLPYYGGSFDLAMAAINRISPFGTYQTRHLCGALIGLIGLIATWRLAERLRGPRAGFLALALLATLPAYYGHMFINPKDIPFAAAMAVVLLWMCVVVGEWPRPRWRTLIALSIAGGVALGTRVGAAAAILNLAIPLAAWIFSVRPGRDRRQALAVSARGCVRLLAVLPLAWLIMVALWPWAGQELLNPLRALEMFSHFPFSAEVMFDGRMVPATDVPRSYLLVFLALTLPESILLGLLAAAVAAVVAAIAARSRVGTRPWSRVHLQLLSVATAALFPLVFFIVAKPTAYNGMRHFLFILPPLAVLAAVGVDDTWRHLHGVWRRGLLVCGVAFLSLPIIRMVALHPYEYIYYNDLMGGPPAAVGRFDLDYWGVSVAETTRGLAAIERSAGEDSPSRPWRVAVEAEETSATPFMSPFMALTDNDDDADFVIDLCPCEAPPGGRIVAQTRRSGVVLSQAYDMRNARAANRVLETSAAAGGGQPQAGRNRDHTHEVVPVQRFAEQRHRQDRGENRHQMNIQPRPRRAHALNAVVPASERQHGGNHADVENASHHGQAGRKATPEHQLKAPGRDEQHQARNYGRQQQREGREVGRSSTQQHRIERPGRHREEHPQIALG